MRKRMRLVQERSGHLLSLKTQYKQHTGQSLSAQEIKLKRFELPVVGDTNVQLAMASNLLMSRTLTRQIHVLEKTILRLHNG